MRKLKLKHEEIIPPKIENIVQRAHTKKKKKKKAKLKSQVVMIITKI